MKKYNVFKVIGIVAAIAIILSYFIPQTAISYGAVTTGDLNPVGIIDTFSNIITSFNVFISPFLFILIISVFYGILKKTERYEEFVNNMAASYNGNKGLFIIVSVLFFGLLSMILSDSLPLLVFVPLAIAVSLKLGYKKTTSVAITLGAMIVGRAGSLYTNVMNQILLTTVSTNILYKIIISLVGLISLIVFVLIFNKPAEKENISKIKSKQLPIVIAFVGILIFIILGMTPWSSYFGFKGFEDLYKTITEFKVLKVSLWNAFVGSTLGAWGAWQIFDVFVLIAIFSLILCICYKIKFNEILEVSAASIKKAIPYASIIILANVILVDTYTSGWFITLVKSLAGKKFNMLSGIVSSVIAAIVYPDYSYGLQFTLSTFTYTITKNKEFYPILALIYQSIYSITLLIAPTSIFILLGLYHLNIRFIEWVKYIWKYFLILFVADIIVIVIADSGFSIPLIVALVILIAVIVMLTYKKVSATTSQISKSDKKEPVKKVEKKEEVKEQKKSTVKKTTKKETKKTSTKKSSK